MNTHWTDQPYFGALDWAKDHHDVIVVDRVGTIVADFRFAHTAPGWEEFSQKMQPFTSPGGVKVEKFILVPVSLESCSQNCTTPSKH